MRRTPRITATLTATVATLALAFTAGPAAATSSPTPAPTSQKCCGQDGQIWNAGPTSLGIITHWSDPIAYDFTIYPGHWSSERKADVDGYYIGSGWRANSWHQTFGSSAWVGPENVGPGRHEIGYGWAREKVVPYRG